MSGGCGCGVVCCCATCNSIGAPRRVLWGLSPVSRLSGLRTVASIAPRGAPATSRSDSLIICVQATVNNWATSFSFIIFSRDFSRCPIARGDLVLRCVPSCGSAHFPFRFPIQSLWGQICSQLLLCGSCGFVTRRLFFPSAPACEHSPCCHRVTSPPAAEGDSGARRSRGAKHLDPPRVTNTVGV